MEALWFFLAGVGIGWLTSYFFYARAKRGADSQHEQQMNYLKESLRQMDEARQREHTIIIALERAGYIEAARDSKGNLTNGYVIRGTISTQLEGVSAAFVATFTPPGT